MPVTVGSADLVPELRGGGMVGGISGGGGGGGRGTKKDKGRRMVFRPRWRFWGGRGGEAGVGDA